MPRFFCEEISDGHAVIQGEDARHIVKSLRMASGEELTLSDMRGTDYLCRILSANSERVDLEVLHSAPCQSEPSVKARLFMAMPKGDKFELIVQKAVELGAAEITPVLTHRCVSRPDARSLEKKLQRYNRVALEAAKQSMRGTVAKVLPMLTFEQAIAEMKKSETAVIFYEQATAKMQTVLDTMGESIAFMVGSEGGFEQSEVQYAVEQGLHCLTLGKRILRCETAPLAALSVIMYASGNMD